MERNEVTDATNQITLLKWNLAYYLIDIMKQFQTDLYRESDEDYFIRHIIEMFP